VLPGGDLGLRICELTNAVVLISSGGVIGALNEACPGSVAVGDLILEINGQAGNACELIRGWTDRRGEGPEELRLQFLRPVEFDILVTLSAGAALGLKVLEQKGFVTDIQSEGVIAQHNELHGPAGPQCLRRGDRIMQVNGREPAQEEEEQGSVLPYLRLAMASGIGTMALRIRRGEVEPPEPRRNSAPPSLERFVRTMQIPHRGSKDSALPRKKILKSVAFSFFPSLFNHSSLCSLASNLKRSRNPAAQCQVSEASACSSKMSRPSKTADRIVDVDDDVCANDMSLHEPEALVLPGVVRRVP
jgi:hypothetical protein